MIGDLRWHCELLDHRPSLAAAGWASVRAMTRWGILATGGIAAKFAGDLRLRAGRRAGRGGLTVGRGGQGVRRPLRRATGVRVMGRAGRRPRGRRDLRRHPHSAHHEAAMTVSAGRQAGALREAASPWTGPAPPTLVDTARAEGVFFMEAMWTRVNPTVRAVLDLIADGAIGEVTTVSADFGIYGPFPPVTPTARPRAGRRRAARPGRLPGHDGAPGARRTRPHPVMGQDRPGRHRREHGDRLRLRLGRGGHADLRPARHDRAPQATITGTAGRIDLPSFFHATSYTLHRPGAEPETVTRAQDGAGYQFEATRGAALPRSGPDRKPPDPARHHPRGDGPPRRDPHPDRRHLLAQTGPAPAGAAKIGEMSSREGCCHAGACRDR